MFFVYSATVGITFAFIFELYTTESIFTAFLVTAGMFGALAVFGAITDIDLTKVGSIAFMALIGLILATIVNIFWANETLYWVTTYAGVLIFAALTAYDMQKITQLSRRRAWRARPRAAPRSSAPSRSTSTSSTSSSSCCGSSARAARHVGEEWGPEPGPDGRPRCWWCLGAEDLLDYHDCEWGRELHGEVELYERLTLEAFQSGLSWLTILRKRENFRLAFDGFDPERVAAYGADDVSRLMADAGIVRNRRKIDAAVTNAQATLALREDGGGLDELIWSFAPEPRPGSEVGPRPAAVDRASRRRSPRS